MGDKEDSQSKVPREVIFGPDAPPPLVLDENRVRKSIYQGWNRNSRGVNDVVGNQQELRLKCLQGWFFRCSWPEKYSFICKICDMTQGLSVLEQVLKSVDAIHCKDVVDSFGRDLIRFGYDVVPTDNNRALNVEVLKDVRREDVVWFISLDINSQVEVILTLLRLGGGGLIFNSYKEVDRLYRMRKEMNRVLEAVNLILLELGDDEDELQGNEEYEGEAKDPPKEDKYIVEKMEQINRRNRELEEFKKKYGLCETKAPKDKKKEVPDVVDHVQLLPLWLNRKIMSYMTESELSEAKKTGKYWAKMAEETVREMNGRAVMRAIIGKTSAAAAELTQEGKEQQPQLIPDDIPTLGREALIRDFGIKPDTLDQLQIRNNLLRVRKLEASTWSTIRFKDICCSVNEASSLIACSTPRNSVQFHSIRTGTRSGHVVTDVPSQVTSIAIHDEGFHIVVGCADGSLACFNIRKNVKTMSYRGHSGRILQLFVTDDKLISASEDRIMKYLDLWTGLCLLCVNLDVPVTAMCVSKIAKQPRQIIAGTAEGEVIIVHLEKKKIRREVYLHEKRVTVINEEGGILVTASQDRSIRVWNLSQVVKQKSDVRPYLGIQLHAPVSSMHCTQNQIYAGCADGKLKLICKISGSTIRTIQVTHKEPIMGIYAMQEKDTTKMIMWHENGIEMRTISFGREDGDKKKKRKKAKRDTREWDRSEAMFLGRSTSRALHRAALKKTFTVKRWRVASLEDRDMVLADRSCAVEEVRKVDGRMNSLNCDLFISMLKKQNMLHLHDHELKTFPRLAEPCQSMLGTWDCGNK